MCTIGTVLSRPQSSQHTLQFTAFVAEHVSHINSAVKFRSVRIKKNNMGISVTLFVFLFVFFNVENLVKF